jgi:hypothetical protein
MPALRDIHEAPYQAFVLKKSTGVRRFAPAAPREQPHRVVVFWGGAWPAASSAGARPVDCSALKGGLHPNKISGVGTNFWLLVHVLPGPNKRHALEPSILLS